MYILTSLYLSLFSTRPSIHVSSSYQCQVNAPVHVTQSSNPNLSVSICCTALDDSLLLARDFCAMKLYRYRGGCIRKYNDTETLVSLLNIPSSVFQFGQGNSLVFGFILIEVAWFIISGNSLTWRLTMPTLFVFAVAPFYCTFFEGLPG